MDTQVIEQAPKDMMDQIERMIRTLSKEELFELYKGLKSLAGDRRKSSRKDFLSEIIYTSNQGAHYDFSKDICEDGLRIETHIPLAVGEKLTITFPLGKNAAEHIKLSGEIVRQTNDGIGVKFHPMDNHKKTLLRKLLDSL